MKILAGLRVTAKSVERTAEAIGVDIADREQDEIRQIVQLDLPIIVGEPIPILYVQMDGTGIPVVKKETEGRRPARRRARGTSVPTRRVSNSPCDRARFDRSLLALRFCRPPVTINSPNAALGSFPCGLLVFLLYAMPWANCRRCGVVAVQEVPWGDGERTLPIGAGLMVQRDEKGQRCTPRVPSCCQRRT